MLLHVRNLQHRLVLERSIHSEFEAVQFQCVFEAGLIFLDVGMLEGLLFGYGPVQVFFNGN